MTNKNDKILAPIKGRVIKFIENQKIEKKSFFDKLGVASSNFRGNALYSEISADIIAKILAFYPNSNPEWLLIGKDPMLREEQKSRLSQNISGNSNIQSGNDTSITGDCKQQIEKLEAKLEEYEEKLAEKDKTISQLVNLMSSK